MKQDVYIPANDEISTNTMWTQQYDYDNLNRLQRVHEYTSNTSLDWQQEYVYDRWGNRTLHQTNTSGVGINKKEFTVNTANNRLGVPGGQTGTMSYDDAGNLTTDTYSGAGVTRAYDAENRMTSETQASDYIAGSYTYNADGQRVRRKVNGVETWAIYGFDGELLAEYAANTSYATPQKEYGYRNGQLLITADPPSVSGTRTNFALAANGAVASASSTQNASYPASATINGDRKGLNWNNGGGWNDATASVYPDWLQVDFNGSKTIDEIDVFTCQDNPASPSEPTEAMTFSLYGMTAFDVQYWNGSSWVTVTGGSVTGNNKVWRKIIFSAVTTSKIRILASNALADYSRIMEVEVWGSAALPRSNMALAANGGAASASSTQSSSYPASATINGDRKGLNWNNGGGWNDATSGAYPDWLQVDFNGSKSIDEIDVFTCQDNPASPSEPTEAMAFTLYGMTAFDVQYWDGSSWVTVTGGSVTGNNKVWRKITFAAVTTSKVRILVNNALADYSRIMEVEAWGTTAGGSTSTINWLVTDQLGTPRMVFDQTGTLATTKRHDYLPFGEELFEGQGLRTTNPLGYSGDAIRQKFTSKERDTETGLDYFGARYCASTQGRFISIDPLLSTGFPPTPQSWNRYSYTLNNPLRLIDPTGMFVIDPNLSKEDQDKIKASYNRLKASLSHYKRGSADYKRIQRGLTALGGIGVKNGITVTVGAMLNPGAGAQTVPTAIDYKGKTPVGVHATITIGSEDFKSNDEAQIAGSLGHEATHAADFKDLALAGVGVGKIWDAFDRIRYNSEFEAYMLEGAVNQALAPDQTFQRAGNIPISGNNQLPYTITQLSLWNPSWAKLDTIQIQTKRSQAVNSILMTPTKQGGHYGLERPKQ